MKKFIFIVLAFILISGCGLKKETNLSDLMDLAEKTGANAKVSALPAPAGGIATNDKFYNIDTSAGLSTGDTILNLLAVPHSLWNLTPLTSAPTPVTFGFYRADNDNWDPLNIAGTDDYIVQYDGASYIGVVDENGNRLVSILTGVTIAYDITADGMADDEYNGETRTGRNCGENLTQWDTVYIANDADPFHQADATAASGEYPAYGMVVAACTDANPAIILRKGPVRNEGWSGLTPGGHVYLGEADGTITQSAPSTANDCVQIIGVALSDSEIDFDFSRPYQLVE